MWNTLNTSTYLVIVRVIQIKAQCSSKFIKINPFSLLGDNLQGLPKTPEVSAYWYNSFMTNHMPTNFPFTNHQTLSTWHRREQGFPKTPGNALACWYDSFITNYIPVNAIEQVLSNKLFGMNLFHHLINLTQAQFKNKFKNYRFMYFVSCISSN